ncbi:MAG: DNA-binding protein [Bacteroidetes bacterium]|nr:MAG: DNA-binding protein [Bacteroidota bacterium]
MPRTKRPRRVVAPPSFRAYVPSGKHGKLKEAVELHYEEYEALRLADYDLLNHLEAALKMGVSRATFARIYESARRKLARALVETREIRSVYGNAELEGAWFRCEACHARFTLTSQQSEKACPMCKTKTITYLNKHR